eukprot:CAMPEP_0175988072 /NCGR_PEP_ID=MMETSP0108-20121206/51049_1 /TAXON_ID=195067 ORGANISM="Goniomonas pacifica, Strain CCMP1869" /NCGR_SAMPLE_ID=MMETSP0108 /ASSEMBLY_ACC=CAM_ASM_000204 /LENGTH=136 /DNA_ID=CAMNT_0017319395 /DNA_START=588 /DNA_END=999 /DNA_ORIENTATION=+
MVAVRLGGVIGPEVSTAQVQIGVACLLPCPTPDFSCSKALVGVFKVFCRVLVFFELRSSGGHVLLLQPLRGQGGSGDKGAADVEQLAQVEEQPARVAEPAPAQVEEAARVEPAQVLMLRAPNVSRGQRGCHLSPQH